MPRTIPLVATIVYLLISVVAGGAIWLVTVDKAQTTKLDARDRLIRGGRTLDEMLKTMKLQRTVALRHTLTSEVVQSALNDLMKTPITPDGQTRLTTQSVTRQLQSIRESLANTLKRYGMEQMSGDDLIIVKTHSGVFWANGLLGYSAPTGEVANAGFGDLDALVGSSDLNFGYLKKGAESVDAQAFILCAETTNLEGEDGNSRRITVAVGRHLSNDFALEAVTTVGTDVSVVASGETLASSLNKTDERALLAARAPQMCPSLGVDIQDADISLEPLPSAGVIPIKLPLFVSNASSHMGCSNEALGLPLGALVLSTRLDGIVEITALQSKVVPIFLLFLVIGLFLVVGLWSKRGSTKEKPSPVMLRKVPIQGQTLNFSSTTVVTGGDSPASSSSGSLASAPSVLPVDPVLTPGGSSVLPLTPMESPNGVAELSPAEFNFGDSLIAEPEMTSEPNGGFESQVSPTSTNQASEIPTQEAEIAEEDALALAMAAALAAGTSESYAGESSVEPALNNTVSESEPPLFDASTEEDVLIDESSGGEAEVRSVFAEEESPATLEGDLDSTVVYDSSALTSLIAEAAKAVPAPSDDPSAASENLPSINEVSAASDSYAYGDDSSLTDGGEDLFDEVAVDAAAALDALFPEQAYDEAGQPIPSEGDSYYDINSPENAYAAQAMDPNAAYGDMNYAPSQSYGGEDYDGLFDASDAYYDQNGGAYGADGYASADPDEVHFDQTYRAFIALRAQCGELGEVNYEQFIQKLRINRDDIVQQSGCSSVQFEVYVKDGRASLRANPIA